MQKENLKATKQNPMHNDIRRKEEEWKIEHTTIKLMETEIVCWNYGNLFSF